jgi:hypothetical protein
MWENAIDEVTDAAIWVLSEELREIVREKRGHQCRKWIAQKPDRSYGITWSIELFRVLASEDSQEYRKHTTMSVEKFDELL